jgi:hypothetical protein
MIVMVQFIIFLFFMFFGRRFSHKRGWLLKNIICYPVGA